MEKVAIKNSSTTRIHEIDLVRGILMSLVILDHFLNLFLSFNLGWAGGQSAIEAGTAIQPFLAIHQFLHLYWNSVFRTVVRWLCLGSFCFVSGISCAFSRNNWKRAGQMIGLWSFIFVMSNILESLRSSTGVDLGIRTARVDFNIIGVLAWSTLTYCFVQDKRWQLLLVVMVVALLLHPICVFLSKTNWGQNTYALFLWRPSAAIADQADYMPLFPYLGFFFGGALLSKFTYGVSKKSYFKQYKWERPFCYIGRHSLIIYVTHFFLLIAIFSFIGLFI
ncbi:MAG: DUF1624 domain-containing protein [Erysipelotrichia bacterium]|nr:DUF1624 domain-containing protein [Erysipelotrichia bacterium]